MRLVHPLTHSSAICLTSTTNHTLNQNREIFIIPEVHTLKAFVLSYVDCDCLLCKFPCSSLPPAQDTSVVSPIVTVLVLASLPFLYASSSPSLLHNNCQLFFLAMCLPFVKTVIIMVVGTSCDYSSPVSFPARP